MVSSAMYGSNSSPVTARLWSLKRMCSAVLCPRTTSPLWKRVCRSAFRRGVLAGYPVVGLKATLVDGSYHPVDSSEMAFKTAASIAYKTALPQASPAILEPIGNLKVTVPDSYTGDIMGDLNKRRGRVLGMEPAGKGLTTIEAMYP